MGILRALKAIQRRFFDRGMGLRHFLFSPIQSLENFQMKKPTKTTSDGANESLDASNSRESKRSTLASLIGTLLAAHWVRNQDAQPHSKRSSNPKRRRKSGSDGKDS